MNLTIGAVLGDYEAFLRDILERLNILGVAISGKLIDHVAYRAISLDNYQQLKEKFQTIATQLGEITINDRPISVFAFHEPLVYGDFRIPYIELLAPNPHGSPFPEGLEHIEVVVDKPLEMPKHYPQLSWKVTEGRTINPEAILLLGNYSVKFHPLPIAEAMRQQLAAGKL